MLFLGGQWCVWSTLAVAEQSQSAEQPASPGTLTSPQAADAAAQSTAPAQPEARPEEEKKREKRGDIVAAPLPISSPALGSGIVPVVGYIFPFNKNDKVSPPSVVGGLGLITSGGSRALAIGGELYLKEDTYEITGGFGGGHLDYHYYGTGTAA